MKVYVVIILEREDKPSLAGEIQGSFSRQHLEPPPTSTSPRRPGFFFLRNTYPFKILLFD